MDQLPEIMAGLAGGDDAYLRSLQLQHGEQIGRFLRWSNRELGLPPLADDDLDGLVWDACEEIARVANGWRPDGGATPWRYARHRLHRLLRDHAGPPCSPFADDLDWAEDPPPVVGADDPPAIAVLDRLVRGGEHPVLHLLQEALELVAAEPEHRELVLRYAEQLAAGDRSPACTVGALLGRPSVNVRQMFCRIRKRLVRLATTDDRFRPLLALPMLTPGDDGAGFLPAAAGGRFAAGDGERSEAA